MKKISLISLAFYLFLSSLAYAQTPITTDSRIRTLVYNPNEVYELKFYYNYQSFIEFSEDEEIEMISIGEAFAWRLTPAGKRLFIRPLEIAAHTNMTIITNKRTYHFDIRSDEFSGKADEDLVYTIRFFYPQIGQPLPIPPQLSMPNPAAKPILPPPAPPIGASIIKTPTPLVRADEDLPGIVVRNPEGLEINLDYSLSGKSDNIMPLKVYDNGSETNFQFPNDNLVIPTISAVDSSGAERSLTYVIRDDYVVVPTVARQFTLRLSDGLLCVFNNKLLGIAR
ncbi:MAG: TrbG/VirB9 family P-type conjugative transfer protein [Proteobacteria bacterium]|nr:TrbG/VirB9 family P-type conjugative transfer protein [Pseudomonadota bacterium]